MEAQKKRGKHGKRHEWGVVQGDRGAGPVTPSQNHRNGATKTAQGIKEFYWVYKGADNEMKTSVYPEGGLEARCTKKTRVRLVKKRWGINARKAWGEGMPVG